MSYFQAKLLNKLEELQHLEFQKSFGHPKVNESRNSDLFTSLMYYVFI